VLVTINENFHITHFQNVLTHKFLIFLLKEYGLC